MIPKSLSASSLNVAALCMKRWEAEYIDRVPGISGWAANIGTSCHGALEEFIRTCYIEKSLEPSWDLLHKLYLISYTDTFGSADTTTAEFKDGLKMVRRWFDRTDMAGFEVESVEVKDNIEIPATLSNGEKITFPLNFVIDRLDRTGPTTWRIVDYKTNRVPIQPEELHSKFQARIYGLAVQIKHPEATEIRVVFDLLRHDPVGTKITRDDNIATWEWLKREAQRIVDTPHDPEPTLNMECGYCQIKATCPLMTQNIQAGGIHSLSIDEVAALKFKIEAQAKGQGYLIEQLDERLLREAAEREELEYSTESIDVIVTASRRRQIDASLVAQIIGPEMFSTLGSITLGVVDELIKDPSIPLEKRNELKKLIYYKTGDPKAKVKPKATLK